MLLNATVEYGGRTNLRNTCATVATVSSSASHLHPVPLILILRLALPRMLHTSALRCSVILSVRTPLHMRRNICNIKIQGSGGGAQIHNSVRSLVSKCCVILSFNSPRHEVQALQSNAALQLFVCHACSAKCTTCQTCHVPTHGQAEAQEVKCVLPCERTLAQLFPLRAD